MDERNVKFDELNESNYALWEWQIKAYLRARNLDKAIERPISFNGGDGSSIQPIPLEQQMERKAFALIISTLSRTNKLKVLDCLTSYDIWTRLASIYTNKTSYESQALLGRLHSYKIESASKISESISEMQCIITKLKLYNEQVSERMFMSIILNALPESFRDFNRQWRYVDEKQRNLNNLISQLMVEVNNDSIEDKAFIAKKQFDKKKLNFICYACGGSGHYARNCRVARMQQEHNQGRRKSEDEKVASIPRYRSAQWVVDSGATSHITADRRLFSNLRRLKYSKTIELGDGNSMEAVGIGQITFGEYYVDEALYVPEAAANLFSLIRAADHGVHGVYNSRYISLCRYGKEMARAQRSDRIWKLNLGHNDNEKVFIAKIKRSPVSDNGMSRLETSSSDRDMISARSIQNRNGRVVANGFENPYPDPKQQGFPANQVSDIHAYGSIRPSAIEGSRLLNTYTDKKIRSWSNKLKKQPKYKRGINMKSFAYGHKEGVSYERIMRYHGSLAEASLGILKFRNNKWSEVVKVASYAVRFRMKNDERSPHEIHSKLELGLSRSLKHDQIHEEKNILLLNQESVDALSRFANRINKPKTYCVDVIIRERITTAHDGSIRKTIKVHVNPVLLCLQYILLEEDIVNCDQSNQKINYIKSEPQEVGSDDDSCIIAAKRDGLISQKSNVYSSSANHEEEIIDDDNADANAFENIESKMRRLASTHNIGRTASKCKHENSKSILPRYDMEQSYGKQLKDVVEEDLKLKQFHHVPRIQSIIIKDIVSDNWIYQHVAPINCEFIRLKLELERERHIRKHTKRCRQHHDRNCSSNESVVPYSSINIIGRSRDRDYIGKLRASHKRDYNLRTKSRSSKCKDNKHYQQHDSTITNRDKHLLKRRFALSVLNKLMLIQLDWAIDSGSSLRTKSNKDPVKDYCKLHDLLAIRIRDRKKRSTIG